MKRARTWIGGLVALAALGMLSSCDGLDGLDYNYLAVGDAGFLYAPLAISDVRLDGMEPDYLETAWPHEFVFNNIDPGTYTLEFTYANVPMVTTIQVNQGYGIFTINYTGHVWYEDLINVVVVDPPQPAEGRTYAIDGESLRLLSSTGLHHSQPYKNFRLNGKAPDRARMGPPHELLWDNLESGTYTMTWEFSGEEHSEEIELKKIGAMLFAWSGELYSVNREYSETETDREYD